MITSVRLEDFKNFRDATLQLGPLTVIVGTNASGKSNIRDAFRFLHGMGRGYSLAEIIGEKYVEGGALVWKGIRGGVKEVSYCNQGQFSITTRSKERFGAIEHHISIGLSASISEMEVTNESLEGEDFILFKSTHRFARLPPHAINVAANVFAGGFERKQYLITQPVLTQYSKEVSGQILGDQLVERMESMRFLDLSPEAMKEPSVPGQIILGDRGENLSSVLLAICQNEDTKHAVIEWVRQLTPLDVSDFEFVPDQRGRVLLTLIESSGRRTSAYSASDGTLRFLAIIAALMGPDAAKFYFLEEIDNGIHPTRLALLLQLIEQQTKLRGIQVVCTTHSPQLLAMLSEESRQHASLVYRLEGATDAKIIRIVDIPGAKEVLETNNLARLHESGWLEDAVSFADTTETPRTSSGFQRTSVRISTSSSR